MRHTFARLIKIILLAVFLGVALLLAWAFESRSMPALKTWHTAVLAGEFTASDATSQTTLQDYLDREADLFDELNKKVYQGVPQTDELIYSRYRRGGSQDPASLEQNWNRTFELVPQQIKGGVLLLHGLTDSPYSLRRIGEIFHARGFYVLGLRLPGHGTIPGALTRVRWQDWVAASQLGARHVRKQIGAQQPFVIAGYSNGGGLAVKYALDALVDPNLPVPDRLLLFSPEIGIAPVADIADSHKLLSFLPYFKQFKWLSIEPEYDPFKYNSFPKNAAQEAWAVTAELHRQIKEAHDDRRFQDFPDVLTFLSWSDATVKTSATVQRLYDKLENEGSELVIFDVNRGDQLSPFIPALNASPLLRLAASTDLPYRLTVITNIASDSQQVEEKIRASRSGLIESRPLPMAWPRSFYSLAHVAIPFAPDDPVYGTGDSQSGPYHGLPLGALQPRGETHLLTVPLGQLMRLRHNPFFAYMEQRIVEDIDKAP
ncbi:MAG: alpha/beta hydrolase [Gammaproteobacteria bacterium]|nr:MAG: alpha/beta hydrolase [Gammaproteobacteria bacterium]